MKFCFECKRKITASGGGTDICEKGHEHPSHKTIEGKEKFFALLSDMSTIGFKDEVLDMAMKRVKFDKLGLDMSFDDKLITAYLLGISDGRLKEGQSHVIGIGKSLAKNEEK